MIKAFICWFWGCAVMKKAFTGETFDTVDRLSGYPIKGQLYRWEPQPYCTRCGKPNKYYKRVVA